MTKSGTAFESQSCQGPASKNETTRQRSPSITRQRQNDSGVGTDCEVEDIEHSEESEEGASEEEDVWSRCVITSNPYGL